MLRTKINGKWVNDPIKDLSNGQPSVSQDSKLVLQNKALIEAMASIAQCKSITEVRKCLTHARAVYPR